MNKHYLDYFKTKKNNTNDQKHNKMTKLENVNLKGKTYIK